MEQDPRTQLAIGRMTLNLKIMSMAEFIKYGE